jgi:hypothetical protein
MTKRRAPINGEHYEVGYRKPTKLGNSQRNDGHGSDKAIMDKLPVSR